MKILTCFALAFFFASVARTQSVWTGAGADNNWSTAANWGGTAPANDGSAAIQLTGSTRPTPNVDAPWNIASLTVPSNTFTLGGSVLTIGAGGIADNGTLTINNYVALSAAQTWTTTSNIFVNGAAITGTGANLTLDGSGTGSIAGSIATGNGTLTKNGSGVGPYPAPTPIPAARRSMPVLWPSAAPARSALPARSHSAVARCNSAQAILPIIPAA